MLQYPITGAIIADGYNSRPKRAKLADPHATHLSIIQRLLSIFKDLFAEVSVVTDRSLAYFDKDVYMASGLHVQKGPLNAIHAALFYATYPHVLVVFDDTPFLSTDFIRTVLKYRHVEKEVIIPEIKSSLEPTLMLLHQKCLPLLAKGITQKGEQIETLWKPKRIHKIPEHLFRKIDPD